jgi:Mg2+/citrate symporter
MNDDYKKLSIDELQKKEKQLKGITGFLIGIMIVGLSASIYLGITEKRFPGGLVVVLGMAAMLPINFKNIKNLREEINSRK